MGQFFNLPFRGFLLNKINKRELKQVHGGNLFYYAKLLGISPLEIIDLSTSVNPLAVDYIREKKLELWDYLKVYPDPEGNCLRELLAHLYSLDKDEILLGNGSLELLKYFLLFILPKGCTVFLVEPTFVGYRKILNLRKNEISIVSCKSLEPLNFDLWEVLINSHPHPKTVILCNPNNPTGAYYSKEVLLDLIKRNPQVLFIIDEAFIDFIEKESLVKEVSLYKNLLVLRSFTKFYGLAGLRVGFMAGNKRILKKLKVLLPTWNTNTLAQVLLQALLLDSDFKEQSLEFFLNEKRKFESSLETFKLKYFPSVCNFYLIWLKGADEFFLWLLEKKHILIRNCYNFEGLTKEYIRVSLKLPWENERFLEALREWLEVS